jgi:hypothetical protein
LDWDVAQEVENVAILKVVGTETEIGELLRLLAYQDLLSYQRNNKEEHRKYLENIAVTSEAIVSFLETLFVSKASKGSIDNNQ